MQGLIERQSASQPLVQEADLPRRSNGRWRQPVVLAVIALLMALALSIGFPKQYRDDRWVSTRSPAMEAGVVSEHSPARPTTP